MINPPQNETPQFFAFKLQQRRFTELLHLLNSTFGEISRLYAPKNKKKCTYIYTFFRIKYTYQEPVNVIFIFVIYICTSSWKLWIFVLYSFSFYRHLAVPKLWNEFFPQHLLTSRPASPSIRRPTVMHRSCISKAARTPSFLLCLEKEMFTEVAVKKRRRCVSNSVQDLSNVLSRSQRSQVLYCFFVNASRLEKLLSPNGAATGAWLLDMVTQLALNAVDIQQVKTNANAKVSEGTQGGCHLLIQCAKLQQWLPVHDYCNASDLSYAILVLIRVCLHMELWHQLHRVLGA